MNPLVALAPIATYEARTLDQTVDQLFTVAGNASGIGRHVLINPTLISAEMDNLPAVNLLCCSVVPDGF